VAYIGCSGWNYTHWREVEAIRRIGERRAVRNRLLHASHPDLDRLLAQEECVRSPARSCEHGENDGDDEDPTHELLCSLLPDGVLRRSA
jgi:hypothetical protein